MDQKQYIHIAEMGSLPFVHQTPPVGYAAPVTEPVLLDGESQFKNMVRVSGSCN